MRQAPLYRNSTPNTALAVSVPSWHNQAACSDVTNPEVFFPGRGEHGVSNKVKATYCANCPVRLKCLEENLDEKHGIYGGTTENERRAIRRQRNRRAA